MSSDPAAFGVAVRQRREGLRLTIKEAATLAGVSDTTWGQVEAGQSASRRTYLGVCEALRWEPDAVDRIANGEEPIELPRDYIPARRVDVTRTDVIDALTERVLALDARVARLERELRAPTGRRSR